MTVLQILAVVLLGLSLLLVLAYFLQKSQWDMKKHKSIVRGYFPSEGTSHTSSDSYYRSGSLPDSPTLTPAASPITLDPYEQSSLKEVKEEILPDITPIPQVSFTSLQEAPTGMLNSDTTSEAHTGFIDQATSSPKLTLVSYNSSFNLGTFND